MAKDVAAFLTWTALGMGVALLAGRTIGRRAIAVRAERPASVVLLVVAALVVWIAVIRFVLPRFGIQTS